MVSGKAIGDIGEQLVVDYLEAMGIEVVARNWRAGGGRGCVGELDLVARDGECLLVVEVKSRGGSGGSGGRRSSRGVGGRDIVVVGDSGGGGDFGDFSPEGAFTAQKIERMMLATQRYLESVDWSGDVEFCLAAVDLCSCAIRFYRDIRL